MCLPSSKPPWAAVPRALSSPAAHSKYKVRCTEEWYVPCRKSSSVWHLPSRSASPQVAPGTKPASGLLPLGIGRSGMEHPRHWSSKAFLILARVHRLPSRLLDLDSRRGAGVGGRGRKGGGGSGRVGASAGTLGFRVEEAVPRERQPPHPGLVFSHWQHPKHKSTSSHVGQHHSLRGLFFPAWSMPHLLFKKLEQLRHVGGAIQQEDWGSLSAVAVGGLAEGVLDLA